MVDVSRERARRAVELGRLRTSLVGASVVTLGLALLSRVAPTPIALPWLVLPFAAWALVHQRGGALARGGVVGLAAGTAGWLLPASVLRPCCATMATTSAACCTRPECCLEAGLVLGLVVGLAVPLPRADRGGHRASASGSASTVAAVAGVLIVAGATLAVRCTGLFVGEAIGLLGGLALGTLAAGGTRVAFAR